MAGVRGHRHTARTSFLMSWQIGEEWKSRGKGKDSFFKATPFRVPRTEIVVGGMFPRENRKRLERQEVSVGVEVWGLACKTELSVILLFSCHLQERIKLFYSQGAGCLMRTRCLGKCLCFPAVLWMESNLGKDISSTHEWNYNCQTIPIQNEQICICLSTS